jgi:hypothetical protein
MHDIVKDEDLSALAAEYVIGTLDPDERTRANVLLEVDEGFRALVRAWERRLGELHLMVEPVEPNGRIWERVRGRLGLRAAEAPPPFTPAPPPFVSPPPPPFGAPAAEPVRAAAAEPKFEPKFEPRFEPKLEPRLESRVESMLESKFESKFELPPAPQLEPASEAPAHDEFAHEELVHEEPVPEEPTPEQRLAALIREADKFSVTADPTATATTVEPAAIIAEPEGDAAAGSQAGAAAMTEEEALLEEAADAIAAKSIESVEPAETDQAGKLAPEQVLTKVEPWPTGAPRRDKMLTPADLARLTFRTQERRLETWRAAMLFMSVVALGLGSLIAAWRFVPERLPMRLQPTAVLGLPDLGPSERIPAQHGTQFEE